MLTPLFDCIRSFVYKMAYNVDTDAQYKNVIKAKEKFKELQGKGDFKQVGNLLNMSMGGIRSHQDPAYNEPKAISHWKKVEDAFNETIEASKKADVPVLTKWLGDPASADFLKAGGIRKLFEEGAKLISY